MINNLKEFAKSAKDLSRNPLGIISLFIVLVYGFACLLFGFSAPHLNASERLPLVWFACLFPVLVLFLFAWLVSKHHNKLYGPSDYRSDESFLQSFVQQPLSNIQSAVESEKSIQELMTYGAGFQVVTEQIERIESDLKAKNVKLTDNKPAQLLIRQLAGAQTLTWLEKTYNVLFASQIELLQRLNSNVTGLSFSVVDKYYEIVKKYYPDSLSKWKTSDYLKFLFASGLILEKDNMIFITRRGNEFLTLLMNEGYPKKSDL